MLWFWKGQAHNKSRLVHVWLKESSIKFSFYDASVSEIYKLFLSVRNESNQRWGMEYSELSKGVCKNKINKTRGRLAMLNFCLNLVPQHLRWISHDSQNMSNIACCKMLLIWYFHIYMYFPCYHGGGYWSYWVLYILRYTCRLPPKGMVFRYGFWEGAHSSST